ncbi:hypothetical protein OG758_44160 [Streptomyces sp. NBC_01474]|nr:hypothetical protein [Streptomyces sp. NBC_01474]WSE00564.1 hypothetical protein OG758_44160 [Streptomyces sp. NBC_01474]
MKRPQHPIALSGTVQCVRHRSKRPTVFLVDHGDLDGKEVAAVSPPCAPT